MVGTQGPASQSDGSRIPITDQASPRLTDRKLRAAATSTNCQDFATRVTESVGSCVNQRINIGEADGNRVLTQQLSPVSVDALPRVRLAHVGCEHGVAIGGRRVIG